MIIESDLFEVIFFRLILNFASLAELFPKLGVSDELVEHSEGVKQEQVNARCEEDTEPELRLTHYFVKDHVGNRRSLGVAASSCELVDERRQREEEQEGETVHSDLEPSEVPCINCDKSIMSANECPCTGMPHTPETISESILEE